MPFHHFLWPFSFFLWANISDLLKEAAAEFGLVLDDPRTTIKGQYVSWDEMSLGWGGWYNETIMRAHLGWGCYNEAIMRTNLLSLIITTFSLSFLQASSPANSTRGSKTLKKNPTVSSDFCDRDRGEILFMAHAVVFAKVRNVVLHFQFILVSNILIVFCILVSLPAVIDLQWYEPYWSHLSC